jgi:hypothetical protein
VAKAEDMMALQVGVENLTEFVLKLHLFLI